MGLDQLKNYIHLVKLTQLTFPTTEDVLHSLSWFLFLLTLTSAGDHKEYHLQDIN